MQDEYTPNYPIPSASEFCEKFGISKITVRQALSDLIKEGLLYGIAGKGTFTSSVNQKKEVNLLKVIIPRPFPQKINWFLEELMEGMKKSAGDNSEGCQIVFDFIGKEMGSIKELVEPLYIKGLILLICWEGNEHLLRYTNGDVPVVVVDYFAPGKTCIKVDNIAGGFKATAHLIKLRHKRIGYLKTSGSFDYYERFEGYKKALREYKLPFEERLIQETSREKESAYLAIEKLLQFSPLPDAICASDYFVTLGAMEAIKKKGLKIPEEIAIVGFDDPRLNPIPKPSLTTVKQPVFEMGYEAIKMLLDLIKGNQQEAKQKLLEPELIIRESCGAYLEKRA